jgi:hypothetical protein
MASFDYVRRVDRWIRVRRQLATLRAAEKGYRVA